MRLCLSDGAVSISFSPVSRRYPRAPALLSLVPHPMPSIPSDSRRPARRNWLLVLAPVALFVACVSADRITGPKAPQDAPLALPQQGAALDLSKGGGVVISQVYGGGGNSGATYKNDFIELHNAGPSDVQLDGWSVQYASAAGTSWSVTSLSGTIAKGGYYLIQEAAGTAGTVSLPTPDATGTTAMSASAGKVALVNSTTALTGSGCPPGSSLIDFVGFGSTASCSEGTGPTPTLTNTTAALRADFGNQDTNDNKADFSSVAPSPRNSSSPLHPGTAVVAGPLDHVAITGGAASIAAGATTQFSAAGKDAANIDVSSATITWGSSDPTVATVDNTGKVTGVSASSTAVTLTATAVADGITKAATTSITITTPPPVATITVSPATWSLKVGQTKAFTTTLLDADGKPTTSAITWSSADPAIATIDASTGILTGKGEGSTTIVATSSNEKKGTAAITVTSASNVTLTSGKTSLALGMQTQFFYGGTDASGSQVTSVVFSTSDPSIITVDQKGVVTGKAIGSARLIATAPDGSAGFTNITVYLAAGSSNVRLGHNTEFGEPKDEDPSDDFLIRRAQYTVSYNPRRGGANWVSWNIDATHLGGSGRCSGTCYSADTALINAGLTAYTTADWVSNAPGVVGYDRGHMAPSADWTSSEADNNTTFFLTNFVPQRHDMNAGPWEKLEIALRDSVMAGREAYVIAGPIFTRGVVPRTLLDLGKIAIPDSTWKIAVITPAGTGINADGTLPPNTTVLAVNMPNVTGILNEGWEQYITTVTKLETSTGYNFLALLAESTQCRVEGRNCAPVARITGASSGNEGQSLSFDASTSSDPDAGNTLSYQWSIDGVPVGTGATLTHTFADNGSFTLQLVATDNFGASNATTQTVNISNVAPSVGALSTLSASEGSAYSATGSFTDPGDDHWAATVDYGDGTGTQPLVLNGKSFTLNHTYSDNGSYPVTITVVETDPEAAAGTGTMTVTVSNVPPSVASFDGATILQGESYAAGGSFTDPGADTWSATVNYGDASGTNPLVLSGMTFQLSHQYTVAGRYVVGVAVMDKDGGTGTGSATVVVQTPRQGAQNLAAMLSTANLPNANSLQAKLDAALKQLGNGNGAPAANQLGAFENELQAMVQSGRVSQLDAAPLLAYAERVINSIR